MAATGIGRTKSVRTPEPRVSAGKGADRATRSAHGRGRPSAERTEAISRAIIAAATQLFLDDGVEKTSMEAIARMAQVPKTTVYKRYPDKRALLRAVLETRINSWSQIAALENVHLTDDLGQRLTHYATLMLEWAMTDEVRAFARLAASADQDSGEPIDRTGILGHSGMVDLLAQEIGEYGPKIGVEAAEPRRVAMALMAMLFGWLELRSMKDPMTKSDAADQAAYFVGLLMSGRLAW